MNTSLKDEAIALRRQGWSYRDITQKLGLAKSTLSHWLRGVAYEPNEVVLERMKNGPAKSVVVRNQRRLELVDMLHDLSAQDIGSVSDRDLLMLGLGLYMGEGSKHYERVRIVNSDPVCIKLAFAWFRRICNLSDENFSVAIHAYPDTDMAIALKYWMEITKLPLEQFTKFQIDGRKDKMMLKHRTLPYGTLHLTVKSAGTKNLHVNLHRKIIGWIKAIDNNMRV